MLFSQIPGHEEVKRRLRLMADTDTIPHALLLEGPPGIGKLALARAFLQYVNCSHRTPDGEPCGRCNSCLQMESLNHIDTFYDFPVVKHDSSSLVVSDDYLAQWKEFLDNETYADFDRWSSMFGKNTRPIFYVSQAADMLHKLSFESRTVRYKSVIVWLPEKMNAETSNKLLKLIEEPYPDTLLLMVSDDPASILPTVYSRLQRIAVKRLPDATIAETLMRRHHALSEVDALAVAHLAEGNMLRAEQALSNSKDAEKRFERFTSLMRLAWTRDVAALKEWSSDMASLTREQQLQFYEYCQHLIRENFMYNFGVPQLNFLTNREQGFSERFARFITVNNVEKIIAELNSAMEDIAANVNAKIVNFDLAIKMILLIKQS